MDLILELASKDCKLEISDPIVQEFLMDKFGQEIVYKDETYIVASVEDEQGSVIAATLMTLEEYEQLVKNIK
ncbi:hypothetical protein GE118_04220 [Mycoplasma sp. NEAQ87857]|uniref:hypothetical protein n=1 Tax=Mycoplasma sp. NEAQ87857 TaxID=2683967 RepID=UPI0013198D9A|nr:hypothetical protein [Mycoplasma sp. NEAQ87857]QGZ97982.1 hypothetical protein GE118_04220 [Mycoplasma sp. NEAQ87857]